MHRQHCLGVRGARGEERNEEEEEVEGVHLYEVAPLQGALGLPQADHGGGGSQPGLY